mmetsp:Transcript_29912/g.69172  ORF Transcript_29912/g.69172 Transcript_29912/m.69172 type:complete len:249 (-) Transcript_29912:99-845(-)
MTRARVTTCTTSPPSLWPPLTIPRTPNSSLLDPRSSRSRPPRLRSLLRPRTPALRASRRSCLFRPNLLTPGLCTLRSSIRHFRGPTPLSSSPNLRTLASLRGRNSTELLRNPRLPAPSLPSLSALGSQWISSAPIRLLHLVFHLLESLPQPCSPPRTHPTHWARTTGTCRTPPVVQASRRLTRGLQIGVSHHLDRTSRQGICPSPTGTRCACRLSPPMLALDGCEGAVSCSGFDEHLFYMRSSWPWLL